METSNICEFYKNKSIFITGGTGFLGKIIIEKLLRSCPDLNKIYLLVRSKKGQTPQQRLENLTNLPCFEPLKNIRPDFLHQLVLIEGDAYKQGLGICKQNLQEVKKCEIVIHAAANVKFDQSLIEAAQNVRAVVEIVAIAQTMPNLCSFIYVSTAYSHCIREEIAEECYPPPMSAKNLFEILNALNSNTIEKITPSLLESYPNTYAYTKAIAEDYFQRHTSNLNCAIVRPAIIFSSMAEPLPGWIDNFYGIMGILAGAGLGAIRTLYVKANYIAQGVPCDYVANHVVAVTWALSAPNSNKNLQIYNYVGSNSNMITWGKFMEYTNKHGWDYATEKIFAYPMFQIRGNRIWNQVCMFFLHTVLAYIADFCLACVGREQLAVKSYKRLNPMLDSLSYFTTKRWIWHTKNVESLWNRMSIVDQKVFMFNMDDLDWSDYIDKSILGGRLYLLKDPIETLPQGRKKLRKLQFIYYLLLTLFWYLMYKLLSIIYCVIFL